MALGAGGGGGSGRGGISRRGEGPRGARKGGLEGGHQGARREENSAKPCRPPGKPPDRQRLAGPDADQRPDPARPVQSTSFSSFPKPMVEPPKSASILAIQRLAGSAKFSDCGHLLCPGHPLSLSRSVADGNLGVTFLTGWLYFGRMGGEGKQKMDGRGGKK